MRGGKIIKWMLQLNDSAFHWFCNYIRVVEMGNIIRSSCQAQFKVERFSSERCWLRMPHSVKLEAQWKWNHDLLNFYYTPARHLHKKNFSFPSPHNSTKIEDLLISWFSTYCHKMYFLQQLFYMIFLKKANQHTHFNLIN